MNLRKFYKSLTRKKPMAVGETRLNRFLSTFDLTVLGIGATLGVGVYIISGDVSKNYTGPAIILSFAIAAFASLLAGLCYAEFGSRVPKAGSAYAYCFVTVGEFMAFIIGWNLILEYAIGSASVAKGISNYIDAITGSKISETLTKVFPINVSFLGQYADFLAFGIIVVITIALAFGAKESKLVNNLFTLINMLLIVFIISCSFFKLNFHNWNIPVNDVPAGYGQGGFLPYGFVGVIRGAGMCFYAFIGFDVIATAGEEARDPKYSIPISICTSLLICFLSYFGISAILTLMVPYYAQDVTAPLPIAFQTVGFVTVQTIVTFGAIFGMISSMFGSMFPLPRIVYAIAEDKMLFEIFAEVHDKYKTPFYGTLITGLLTGLLAMLFDLHQLINMMSIGTIMAYSIVAACVLLLRYEVDDLESDDHILSDHSEHTSFCGLIFNTTNQTEPTKFSSALVTFLVTIYAILCGCMSVLISQFGDMILSGHLPSIVVLSTIILFIIIVMLIINQQPQSSRKLSFKTPFTPWFPALSIMINIHLMVELDVSTWIRFGVWVGCGLLIYFGYSRRRRERMLTEACE